MCEIVLEEPVRIFVATWNVGGRAPHSKLNLEDLLKVHGPSDIYVLGFQEIVPLNAGNVLVIEDNEPAARWLCLIGRALNSPGGAATELKPPPSGHLFFKKPSLKILTRNYRPNGNFLKSCTCSSTSPSHPRRLTTVAEDDEYHDYDDDHDPESNSYSLIFSKQMVGIFLSIWVRRELVPHVGHLRSATVGRGIMGCLGNKGCIAISMSLYRTTVCFICSHLASGEKEGDELRRNVDVSEILKNTHFPKVCKTPLKLSPRRILQHERVIWFGDLNYRVALSYADTKELLEENDWDALLRRDQLVMEMKAGRIFRGWTEGKIEFAPTYKYTHNSDFYAGETAKSEKKRRTPAWCDRILWYGKGIEQLTYIRGESRFSDHRPVCGVFLVDAKKSTLSATRREGTIQEKNSIGGEEKEDALKKYEY